MKSTSFRDLIVWQKAHQLVLGVYNLTAPFPDNERYGLTSQVRRSAVSIAANVAESFKKRSRADKLRMMNISQGSLSETEYYLMLSSDLGYGKTNELLETGNEVGKLLEGYMNAIRKSI